MDSYRYNCYIMTSWPNLTQQHLPAFELAMEVFGSWPLQPPIGSVLPAQWKRWQWFLSRPNSGTSWKWFFSVLLVASSDSNLFNKHSEGEETRSFIAFYLRGWLLLAILHSIASCYGPEQFCPCNSAEAQKLATAVASSCFIHLSCTLCSSVLADRPPQSFVTVKIKYQGWLLFPFAYEGGLLSLVQLSRSLAALCQVGVVSTGVAKALQGVLVFVLSHALYCRWGAVLLIPLFQQIRMDVTWDLLEKDLLRMATTWADTMSLNAFRLWKACWKLRVDDEMRQTKAEALPSPQPFCQSSQPHRCALSCAPGSFYF